MTFHGALVEAAGQAITRRQFLARLGAAALGAAMAMMRVSFAEAYDVVCCHLCHPPGGPWNLPDCSPPGNHPYRTKWCWFCDYGSRTYKCCEAKDPYATCYRDCDKVFASWYERTGYASELNTER